MISYTNNLFWNFLEINLKYFKSIRNRKIINKFHMNWKNAFSKHNNYNIACLLFLYVIFLVIQSILYLFIHFLGIVVIILSNRWHMQLINYFLPFSFFVFHLKNTFNTIYRFSSYEINF